MKWGDYIVYAIAGLSLLAAIGYFFTGDWKRGVYWTCVGVIHFISIYL